MNGLIYTNSYEGRARNLQTKIKMLLGFLASGISGLVAEYIVAIDVTRVRFPADAVRGWGSCGGAKTRHDYADSSSAGKSKRGQGSSGGWARGRGADGRTSGKEKQRDGRRELRRGAWKQGFGYRGLGAGTWGQGPGDRNLGTGTWGQGPGDRGLGTGSWGQGLGDRGPASV